MTVALFEGLGDFRFLTLVSILSISINLLFIILKHKKGAIIINALLNLLLLSIAIFIFKGNLTLIVVFFIFNIYTFIKQYIFSSDLYKFENKNEVVKYSINFIIQC